MQKANWGGGIENKAFTLIELLAVIVILAVIALIATPIILNIIEKAKKSAFLDSAYGIEQSARLVYMENVLSEKEITEKVFTFDGNKPEGLNYNGEVPKGGSLIIRTDGTILLALHNGNWCATKGQGDSKITLTKYESDKCVIPENTKDPVLALKGSASITLKVGETYTELGAEAKTVDGSTLTYTTEIKKDEEVVTSIDTSSAGKYIITYKAESNGKTSIVTRTVTIEKNEISTNELAIQDNLSLLADLYRYRGENPNNWVCFGDSSITEPANCGVNHKWRIIGIDSEGKIKIMTNYYYSEGKAFDTTGGPYESNNWGRPADLKTELNGSAFYSNNTYIDETHREYITNTTWYTGGQKPSGTYTLEAFQSGEKNSSTTGYVGLMSITDFGYASSSCTTDTDMNALNNVCMNNNWIGYDKKNQWPLTPPSDNRVNGWFVSANGLANASPSATTIGVRPSVFLDSNVKITGGKGTETEPYILSK